MLEQIDYIGKQSYITWMTLSNEVAKSTVDTEKNNYGPQIDIFYQNSKRSKQLWNFKLTISHRTIKTELKSENKISQETNQIFKTPEMK